MSTSTPSRLNDVSDAATFLALTQSNFTILAGEIATRTPTYQNGNPTTIIGPPTSGARELNEFFPYYNERRRHQGLGNRTPHEPLFGTPKKRTGGAGAGRRLPPPFGSKGNNNPGWMLTFIRPPLVLKMGSASLRSSKRV